MNKYRFCKNKCEHSKKLLLYKLPVLVNCLGEQSSHRTIVLNLISTRKLGFYVKPWLLFFIACSKIINQEKIRNKYGRSKWNRIFCN